MSKLCLKIIRQMRDSEKRGVPQKTVILISHLMMKMGVVFGSPMEVSGGKKQKYLAALIVRVAGKNIIDAKVSKVMPIAKETQFVLEKWKVPIVAANGMFTMVTRAHDGLQVGECDDWNTVAAQLKNLGLLVKGEKGGWLLCDAPYPKLEACKAKMLDDKKYALAVKKALIERAVADGLMNPSEEEATPD